MCVYSTQMPLQTSYLCIIWISSFQGPPGPGGLQGVVGAPGPAVSTVSLLLTIRWTIIVSGHEILSCSLSSLLLGVVFSYSTKIIIPQCHTPLSKMLTQTLTQMSWCLLKLLSVANWADTQFAFKVIKNESVSLPAHISPRLL